MILPDSGGTVFNNGSSFCEAYDEGATLNATYYHDGSGTTPTSGDEVYTNNVGTLQPDDGIIGMFVGRAVRFIEITSGAVAGTPSEC